MRISDWSSDVCSSDLDYVLKNGVTGQDSTQGNPFPQLAVGEYRVLSSNYKAEFDQVSSVAITAVTKSGTNEFHGEAFIDYTDQSLRDARPNELKTSKDKPKDFQFGGAHGGRSEERRGGKECVHTGTYRWTGEK